MSLSEKTQTWLADNAVGSWRGKTVLVTGADSGVGFSTAEIAAFLGAKVILACRDPAKASAAKAALLKDYPGAAIGLMRIDLASLASIRSFVRELSENGADIDVFVNNAGVFRQPGKTTEDGFDLVIGTNYIGAYYLTELLLPVLAALPHEVFYINTISLIHKAAAVKYDDFYCSRHYNDLAVYARSKLCLAKATYALAQRYKNSGLHICMNHPGITITPLALHAVSGRAAGWALKLAPLFNAPEKSALSAAYILSRNVPAGSIVGPSRGFGGWGYPGENHVCRKVKCGVEELIRFTDGEIRKALARGDKADE